MSPHGAGMSGATHSHDPEYPDDNWNLYSMLDHETTIGLNVTKQEDVLRIFKSHANKLSNDINVISDADEEICIIARFTSPVCLTTFIIYNNILLFITIYYYLLLCIILILLYFMLYFRYI